jgi:hypothetical protein
VRIPLADFPGWSLVKKSIHGIRLTFDQASQGAIYVANIRLSSSAVNLTQFSDLGEDIATLPLGPAPVPAVRMHPGTIAAVQHLMSLAQREGAAGVEIEVASGYEFPVRDNLLTLRIGSRTFTSSRYVDGDLHRVVFSLTAAEFAAVSASDTVLVHYGNQPRGDVWNCGRLDGRG